MADFLAPFVPAGWLELDGSVISTSTYAALYAVMSSTTSGTRTNGSPIITSIPSTTGYKAGYFVFGTGITSGSTIVTVDSPTQITISIAATSSGSSAFAISPWLLNTGTITLPNVTTTGRYRRSRSATTSVGQLQSDQNLAHTHANTAASDTVGNHTHVNTLNDPTHSHLFDRRDGGVAFGATFAGGVAIGNTVATSASATGVTITNAAAGSHTHVVTMTNASSGSTEARPTTLICLTCVKT